MRDLVHAGLSGGELAEARARFLADQGWASANETAAYFAEHDPVLADFAKHEEVV